MRWRWRQEDIGHVDSCDTWLQSQTSGDKQARNDEAGTWQNTPPLGFSCMLIQILGAQCVHMLLHHALKEDLGVQPFVDIHDPEVRVG